MTATNVRVQMQQRKDTAANWASANPTLLSGELGYETDTGKWKVGTGSAAWSSLAYTNWSQISYPIATADIADDAVTGAKLANNIDIAGTLDVTSAATFDNNVVVQGNLTVNGTTTTIDTTTLLVKDKNIELGVLTPSELSPPPSDFSADGGGITLKGTTDKTITWIDATDAWTFSEHLDIASGKEYRINGTKVLDATSLGSAVVGSSLTSVGTIGTGVWNGTAIASAYIADSAITSTKIADSAVTSAKIADGTIINADVNASAAIAGSKITTGTTSAVGVLQLTDSTLSTSTTTAATPNAVKTSFDLAGAALPKAGGTMTGDIVFNSGQTIAGYTPRTNATGSAQLPAGTELERDSSPSAGFIRFNTDVTQFEGYTGTAWASVGGGATGGGSNTWALEHDNTITDSYSISSGKNVISAGPLTVNSGATVTVPSGSNWVIA